MQLKVGDRVASDWGTGTVVAITKHWLIHEFDNMAGATNECAINRDGDGFWIPVDECIPGGGGGVVDVPDIEE